VNVPVCVPPLSKVLPVPISRAFDTFSGPQGCEGVGVRLIKQSENPSSGAAWGACVRKVSV
jgi:hypothetical protein